MKIKRNTYRIYMLSTLQVKVWFQNRRMKWKRTKGGRRQQDFWKWKTETARLFTFGKWAMRENFFISTIFSLRKAWRDCKVICDFYFSPVVPYSVQEIDRVKQDFDINVLLHITKRMDLFSFVKYNFMQSIILCSCRGQLYNWHIADVSDGLLSRLGDLGSSDNWSEWWPIIDGISIADVC